MSVLSTKEGRTQHRALCSATACNIGCMVERSCPPQVPWLACAASLTCVRCLPQPAASTCHAPAPAVIVRSGQQPPAWGLLHQGMLPHLPWASSSCTASTSALSLFSLLAGKGASLQGWKGEKGWVGVVR